MRKLSEKECKRYQPVVKKNLIGRLGQVLGLAVILTGATSYSTEEKTDRVLVQLKQGVSVRTIERDFVQKTELSAKGHRFGFQFPKNSLAQVEVQFEEALDNLNSVVLKNVSDVEMFAIEKNPNVLFVDREVIHPLPEPTMAAYKSYREQADFSGATMGMPGAKTPWGILAVKAPEAWAGSAQGAGVRVLVLDTGLDERHPSIRDNFEAGRNFLDVPKLDNPNDFKDLVGHGTHCSGTIAGVMDTTGFTGVAPKAKLLAGRVCFDRGCSNISIAKGISWGISQKVDVISMSLGGKISTPSERAAIAQALKAGVIVVAASGNDGSDKVSYPAALPGVIAVGAVDSGLKKAGFSQYGPELSVVAPGVGVVSTVPMGEGRESEVQLNLAGAPRKVNSSTFVGSKEYLQPQSGEVVYADYGKAEDFKNVSVRGKIALIQRGEITFIEKVNNALEAGAEAIVIANNQPGLISGVLSEDGTSLGLGIFMIEQTVGDELKLALAKGKKLEMSLRTILTDYAAFSGTSMATPHVAGVVALMKAANPKLDPVRAKMILKSTATSLGPNEKNQFGSGLVNAEKAVTAAKL